MGERERKREKLDVLRIQFCNFAKEKEREREIKCVKVKESKGE